MADKITKALERLTKKEKERLKKLLAFLKKGELSKIDIKKLKGRHDIFRICKGSIRVIFRKISGKIKVLSLERRNSKTYRRK